MFVSVSSDAPREKYVHEPRTVTMVTSSGGHDFSPIASCFLTLCKIGDLTNFFFGRRNVLIYVGIVLNKEQ